MDNLVDTENTGMPGSERPAFLSRVAADIVDRYGADLQEIAIVFNNQRPAHYLKKHLAERLGRSFWSPQFFTIQDFLRRSTSRTEISGTTQAFLLSRLHTELQRERNPGFEESLDHFFPVAEIILDDFAQLDYELAPVDAVFEELAEQALIDRQFDFLTPEQQDFLVRFWSAFSQGQQSEMHTRFLQLWRMLPLLYRRFKDELVNQGNHTIAGIYRDLAENQPSTHDVITDYKQVLFVGFNALNACESTLFKRWQDQNKALFYFDADAYYDKDPMMEAGFFIRQNIGIHGLRNALGDFPAWIAQPRSSGSFPTLKMLAAPGNVAQAKILAQMLTEHPHGSTAAVILADESLLAPVLQSIPEDLDVNITMGYPMSESLTHSFIDLYLEAQLQFASQPGKKRGAEGEEIGYELLIDVIAHPFSGCTTEIRSELMKKLGEHQAPLLSLSWVRSVFKAQSGRFPRMFQAVDDVGGLMVGLHELLNELSLNPDLSAVRGRIEFSLIEKAIQTFRQMQSGFEAHPELSISLAVRLIRRVAAKLTATLRGDPLTGLQVMGLLESRNLNFDVIYLLGANEGKLPSLHASPSFIPYNIRRAYRLPVIENQQALSAYLFYRLLHSFDRMAIVYNGVIDNRNSGEVTRFAKQIAYESGLPVTDCLIEVTGAVGVADPERNEINVDPTFDPRKGIPKDGPVWEQLMAFFRESVTGERRYLSASAFSLYLNSPLEFFFRYIAGIKEPPDLLSDIRSNRLGSVIHRAMELLLQPFAENGAPLNREKIRSLLPRVGAVCRQAVIEEFYGDFLDKPQPAAGIRFTSQERIALRLSEEYCRLFLRHDENLGEDIHIGELENDTDYVLEFPINVNGKEETILLKGIIDRVDVVGDQKRIVDYKTGRDVLEVDARGQDDTYQFDYDFFKDNWDNSNKAFIQTMYYTYIYEQVSGQRAVEPHLYSIRHIRSSGTLFKFKIPYRGVHSITGSVLEQVKADFVEFLRQKIEELFDPSVPFFHPPGATVYPGNPFAAYVAQTMDFAEDEDQL